MNMLVRLPLLLLLSLSFHFLLFADETIESTKPATITTVEALDYMGTTSTVCGVVVSTRYLSATERKLTFLNLDQAFPNQKFDVVIENVDRAKFTNPPEEYFKNKKVCVTGLIEIFKGKAQMYVTSPDQITVIEAGETE